MATADRARSDALHDEGSSEARELDLRDGRKLTLDTGGEEELVEIRGSSGLLELRIRVTEEGPVLELESVRISLRASESVAVECREFKVNAEESLGLSSQGEIAVRSTADLRVEADGEVHVTGEMIYLN